MQQIQITANLTLLGSKRSPGDIATVLPDTAERLIAAGVAISYSPETKPIKAKEVKDV